MKTDLLPFAQWCATTMVVAMGHFALVCCIGFPFVFALGMTSVHSDPLLPWQQSALEVLGSVLFFPLRLFVDANSPFMIVVVPLNSALVGLVLGSLIVRRGLIWKDAR